MSLDFLTKPIGGSRKKDADADDAPARGRARGRGRGRTVHPETVSRPGGAELVVGGMPRVDLMPPEVRIKRTQLRTRRNLRLGLVGVVTLTLVICGATFAWKTVNQTALALAQLQQQQLVQQQSQFGEVTTTANKIALIEAGQRVGSSTEIQWAPFITALQNSLPEGMTLTNVSAESASPVGAFAQSATPLQGGRVATVTFSITSAQLPSVADLLDAISKLPGYADASPGSVTSADGVYQATVVMHVGTAALSDRFAKTEK